MIRLEKPMLLMKILKLLLVVTCFAPQSVLAQVDATNKLPDEYESAGGTSNGFGNGGVAITTGIAAVRTNPAMLSELKEYTVNMGYHWPTTGREFFQAGVVDSKTSNVAAGFSYTGFNDDYDKSQLGSVKLEYDSPIIKRAALAFAQPVGAMSAGIGGTYVEAHPLRGSEEFSRDQKKIKGYALNFGLAGYATQRIRWAVSTENISNKKIKDYAPTTYRVGGAYLVTGDQLSLHLDYKQRQKVAYFEAPEVNISTGEYSEEFVNTEKIVIASFSAKIYDLLRLLGAYGNVVEEDRQTLSGGIALINQKFSLSYTINKPNLKLAETHNSLNLGFAIAM